MCEGSRGPFAAAEDEVACHVVGCVGAFLVVASFGPSELYVASVGHFHVVGLRDAGFGFIGAGVGAELFACEDIDEQECGTVPAVAHDIGELQPDLASGFGEVGREGDGLGPVAYGISHLRAYLNIIYSGKLETGESGGIADVGGDGAVHVEVEGRCVACPAHGGFRAAAVAYGEILGHSGARRSAGCVAESGLGQEVLLADVGTIAAYACALHVGAYPETACVVVADGLVDADEQVAAFVVVGFGKGDDHLVADDGEVAAIDLVECVPVL